MKIVFLDAATIGDDLTYESFEEIGEIVVYPTTSEIEFEEHIQGADVVVINKLKLNASNLPKASKLKLICLAATGFDNVDLDYCRKAGIGVCNVIGYSTQSVAQLTLSMALSLYTHLNEYTEFVRSGEYTQNGLANRLSPVYHEIAGKTWGIVGYGNIGKQVARVAEAMGCRVLVYKRTPIEDTECVDFNTICQKSDILSLHVPLNDETRNLLDKEHIAMLKKDAVVINVARGAVADEAALADAILKERIGALGVDVYSKEPFDAEHPFNKIKHLPNVLLTPHMAWGGYETRVRLLGEIKENVISFYTRKNRCRVD
ncbi:MAG: hydroxyacid dehydrogenase [Ruminococcaceae bacterium]|nr:hydroxyacid dehydrogenase [Oscillospiraceae bacterium]